MPWRANLSCSAGFLPWATFACCLVFSCTSNTEASGPSPSTAPDFMRSQVCIRSFPSRELPDPFALVPTLVSLADGRSADADGEGVVRGTMENGMPWVLVPGNPGDHKILFRLVVSAGSLHETDDQRGYAHFLEHMGFNGTHHHPRGLAPGAPGPMSYNAWTSYGQTVYTLDLTPGGSAGLADALAIMDDFSGGQLLDPAEVEAEKPVVLEEMRMRTASDAPRSLPDPALDGREESRYDTRTVLGTALAIGKADSASLGAFLDAWYRPERMCLIIQGPVEAREVRAASAGLFASRPVAAVPEGPDSWEHSLRTATVVCMAAPVAVDTLVMHWDIPSAREPSGTLADHMVPLLGRMVTRGVGVRLEARLAESGGSLQSCETGMEAPLFGTRENRWIQVVAGTPSGQDAGRSILAELGRIRREGFTARELDLVRTLTAAREPDAYATHDDTLIFQYLRKEAFHSTEELKKKDAAWMQALSLEDFNAFARSWLDDGRARITVMDGSRKPYAMAKWVMDDLESVRRDAGEIPGMAGKAPSGASEWPGNAPDVPVAGMGTVSAGRAGGIVSERSLGGGLVEWTLSNRVRVYLDSRPGSGKDVSWAWLAPGGLDGLDDDLVVSAHIAALVPQVLPVLTPGINSRTDLLKGKGVEPVMVVQPTARGLYGAAKSGGLPVVLSLIHGLAGREPFTEEEADRVWIPAFEAAKITEKYLDRIRDRIWWEGDIRRQPLSPMSVQDFDRDRLQAAWDLLIGDVCDFRLVISGDFRPGDIRKDVEEKVASLAPGTSRDFLVPRLVPLPRDDREESSSLSSGGASIVFLTRLSDGADHRASWMAAQMVRGLLQERIVQEIREKAGASYSVRMMVSGLDNTLNQYKWELFFDCKPSLREAVTAKARKAMDDLAARGLDEAAFLDLKARMKPVLAEMDRIPSNRVRDLARDILTGQEPSLPEDSGVLLESLDLAAFNAMVRDWLGGTGWMQVYATP